MNESTLLFRRVKYIYYVLITVLAITGLAQMPLFKRYYIADLPGLGWTGDFIVTHYMHHTAAILFLSLVAYVSGTIFFGQIRTGGLSWSGKVRVWLLILIGITGILKLIENLPGVIMPQRFVFILDISHILLTLIFIVTALFFMIGKKGWLRKN